MASFDDRCAASPEPSTRLPAVSECVALTADNSEPTSAETVMNGTVGRLGQVKGLKAQKRRCGGGSLAGRPQTWQPVAGLVSLVLSVIISVAMQKCCGSGEKRMVTLSHSIDSLYTSWPCCDGCGRVFACAGHGALAGLPFFRPSDVRHWCLALRFCFRAGCSTKRRWAQASWHTTGRDLSRAFLSFSRYL